MSMIDDEEIQTQEDIKEAKRAYDENQTKLVEAERKNVVVKRDVERVTAMAETFLKRKEILEETIQKAKESFKELEEREGQSSLKEERNAVELLLKEGQYKELEVRAEASERCCVVLERNISEAQIEIDSWVEKTEEMEKEIREITG